MRELSVDDIIGGQLDPAALRAARQEEMQFMRGPWIRDVLLVGRHCEEDRCRADHDSVDRHGQSCPRRGAMIRSRLVAREVHRRGKGSGAISSLLPLCWRRDDEPSIRRSEAHIDGRLGEPEWVFARGRRMQGLARLSQWWRWLRRHGREHIARLLFRDSL